MPGWAGSSWYFLRYMDAHNDKEFVNKKAVDYWQNVDLYIGGAEHATGHLLYVRFWTKFLNDLGLIPVTEPAKKLINQGMIQGVSEMIFKVTDYVKDPQNVTIQTNRIPTWNENTENFDFHLEDLNDRYHIYISADIVNYYSGKCTPYNIPIEYTYSNILNLKKYNEWESVRTKKIQKSVFVTKSGNTIINVVNDKFEYPIDGEFTSKIFKTKPEIEKMSKSKWNVVSPDLMVEQYGADALRLYEMFLGPLELSKPWNTNGITGVSNFIRKLWRLYHTQPKDSGLTTNDLFFVSEEHATKPELKVLHKTIKKIISDIEGFSFNTSVSNFMICVNELTELKCNKREILEPLAIIIAPYAPHIAEELWSKLGHNESITYTAFPECKEEYLVESAFNYPVSFNGKTRFFQEYDLSLSKEAIEKEVLALEQTQKYLEGKTPKKIIVVHNKIVNIVV